MRLLDYFVWVSIPAIPLMPLPKSLLPTGISVIARIDDCQLGPLRNPISVLNKLSNCLGLIAYTIPFVRRNGDVQPNFIFKHFSRRAA